MKPRCKKCIYWRIDKTFAKTSSKIDKREIGFCFLYPPKLMQNIVPSIIREKGLSNIKENTEYFQFRPMTEDIDLCSKFKPIKKKARKPQIKPIKLKLGKTTNKGKK